METEGKEQSVSVRESRESSPDDKRLFQFAHTAENKQEKHQQPTQSFDQSFSVTQQGTAFTTHGKTGLEQLSETTNSTLATEAQAVGGVRFSIKSDNTEMDKDESDDMAFEIFPVNPALMGDDSD